MKQILLLFFVFCSLTSNAQMNSDLVNSMQFKPIPYKQQNPIDIDNAARVFSQLAAQHEAQKERFGTLFDKGVANLERGNFAIAKLYFEQCLELNKSASVVNPKVILDAIMLCDNGLTGNFENNLNSGSHASDNNQAKNINSEKRLFDHLYQRALDKFGIEQFVDAKVLFKQCLDINKKYHFIDDSYLKYNIELCDKKIQSKD